MSGANVCSASGGLSSESSPRDERRLSLVRVGEVDAGRGDLVQLLAVAGDGVGEVDDVEDLGAAEAGDLHSAHAVRLWPAQPRT